ncbi:MAG: FixH family protein [Calditrichaceae bacterium]
MISKFIWPTGIIIVFSGFVMFFLGYLIFSTSQNVDLVSKDYYTREIDYQRQIDRMKRTKPFASMIKINMDKNEKVISLVFPEFFQPGSVKGTIHMFRPSDAGRDRTIKLSLNHEREQSFPVESLTGGFWKIKLDWSYEGVEYFFEKSVVVL